MFPVNTPASSKHDRPLRSVHFVRVLAVTVLVALLGSRPVAGQLFPSLEVVVKTGDPLPGGATGTFNTFGAPVLNDHGEMAIRAQLSDTGVPGDGGLFRANADGVTQVIRFGDSLPGAAEPFQGLRGAFINNAGHIAGEGGTNGPQDNMILLFDAMDRPQIVAQVGDRPPVGSGTYVDFGTPFLNNMGQVAFSVSFVRFGSPNQGVFIGDANGLTEIVRGGIHGNPAMNNSGQAIFRSILNDATLHYYDGASLTQLAVQGDSIPGGNGTFGDFSRPSINDAGQAAILSTVRPPGGGSSVNGIFFFDPDSGLADAVPRGSAAPDGNGTIDAFSVPFLNNSGQMAFAATLADTQFGSGDNAGAFLVDGVDGTVIQIARELDPAPDGDGVFDSFTGSRLGGTIALNDRGHAAFDAMLRGASGGLVKGLFLYAPSTGILEIIREGDSLLNSTVADFTFNSGLRNFEGILSNAGNSFNNLDQVAFSFRLADGTRGVAIASVVPETGSLLLIVAGAILARCYRFREL